MIITVNTTEPLSELDASILYGLVEATDWFEVAPGKHAAPPNPALAPSHPAASEGSVPNDAWL